MESPFEGAVLDPVKCSKLSMEERREIVYELANWSHGAAEMLQTWSRQDILQILCSEMGKERKYTGLTKLKIIEHLLKVVSEKRSIDHNGGALGQSSSPSSPHKAPKRPRKAENPSRLLTSSANVSPLVGDADLDTATYCKNAACKARLSKEDTFCKRCSCCICRKYDDNKDPSLWLTCSSEAPFLGDSCNMSCHLECALKHGRSGIARNGLVSQLDGSFYCVSCGKMNDLMRCWRKQLMVAKDTRRVDILCYRISLSQKLLAGTKKYRNISEIVDNAVKKLEEEVGTLTGDPVTKGRGIVNRLSSGQEVQRLCASAVGSFDSMISSSQMHQDSKMIMPNIIRVEDISSTAITVILGPYTSSKNNVGYTLWHCKANDVKQDVAEPTCTLLPPQTRFIVSGLSPATEYIFKVSSFDNTKELSSSEVRVTTLHFSTDTSHSSLLSNPSSVEDESNNFNSSNEPLNSTNTSHDQNPSCASDEEHTVVGRSDDALNLKAQPKHSSDGQVGEATSTDNGSSNPEKSSRVSPPRGGLQASLPITPCRLEGSKDGPIKKGSSKPHNKNQDDNGSGKDEEVHARSSSKKRCSETQDEEDGPSGGNLEYYIKVIRWLECEGHIEKGFRQKFLTWYSIRATPQETRIVKAFVDTLIDDPASLSEQLLDTFGEIVSSKRSSAVSPGFCLKLWH